MRTLTWARFTRVSRWTRDVQTVLPGHLRQIGQSPHLLGQLAHLDIARALYLRGDIRTALRALHVVTDPRLAARVLLLRAELKLTVRQRIESCTYIESGQLRDAYEEAPWMRCVAFVPTRALENIVRSIGLLRAEATAIAYGLSVMLRLVHAAPANAQDHDATLVHAVRDFDPTLSLPKDGGPLHVVDFDGDGRAVGVLDQTIVAEALRS